MRQVPFLLCSVAFLGTTATPPEDEHSLYTSVLQEHVQRGSVDYAAIREDERFHRYIDILSAVDPADTHDPNKRLAFWINVYNAFTIQLILDHYPLKSIRDIKKNDKGPWDIPIVRLKNRSYTLNHVEHEIIRKEFSEPRIHLALVCAARSCPPLRSEAYEGDKLQAQLDDNARAFIRDTSKNRFDRSTHTLYLSELFQWYGTDFTDKFGSAASYVARILGLPDTSAPVVKYIPYDWTLNERP